ncbi:MAG TPA: alpha-2-macroglobulin family protein, partial [Acidobacteriota bacterium]|nr:alpha-2-macroglobulin family protein [Acidobacteriota bacterium]
ITEPVHRYQLPILESHVPNMTVQVDLTGATTRTNRKGLPDPNLPLRPAFATGNLELVISPVTRTLTVTATPYKPEVKPGEDNVVDVQVVDSQGIPVPQSECAVVVVDEAILALTSYRLIDPIKWFYVKRPAGTETERSRHDVLLADLEKSKADKPKITRMGGYGGFGDGDGDFGDGDGSAARPTPRPAVPVPGFKERKNFNPLAVFSPAVRTNAEGKATIKFTMPDTLTRYRVMVVAVAGENKFGKIENVLTARLPLAIKPAPPRFLNYGDQCEFPVVIQNQTSSPQDVKVVIRSNRIEFSDGSGQQVTVPANDQLEVRFPGTATQVGDAQYQVAALAGDFTDAVSGKIPIYTPATTEAAATYGEVDSGSVTQPVALPSNVFPEYGGLEISTSSTQLQELTDAVLYLANYPYDCSEQIASRLLSIAALHDVLTAFQSSEMPPPGALISHIAIDLSQLRSLQHVNGGFSFWKKDDADLPFVSIHVAHALALIKAKKLGTLGPELTLVHAYLRNIERHFPDEYSVSTRQILLAYALYVRHLLGDTDLAKARKLTAVPSPEALPLDAIGWVLPVLASDPAAKDDVDRFLKHLNNRVTETAATANFINAVLENPEILLYSNRRTDGILLNALMAAQPDNPLIPKLVRGLLGHRVRGRWLNTQENVFILLALDQYFRTYEKATPGFIARAWLGQTFAGEHTFRGRTTEQRLIEVPMSVFLAGPLKQDVVLQKTGVGRMYYRVSLKYAPQDKMQRPLDAGFKVSRQYEAVDHPDDVKQVSETEWSIRAGARVKITVRMVAQATRYHVALVDPLPAGLEILNPVLATTGDLPDGRLYAERSWGSWLRWRWFEHENLKSDRAEVFKTYVYPGIYQYSYYAQATTPGTFFALPPKAEEMYFPETFGRGQTDVVTVK